MKPGRVRPSQSRGRFRCWQKCHVVHWNLFQRVFYNTIDHIQSQWQMQEKYQTRNSQKTLHTSSSRARYRVSFVSILKNNGRVIKGSDCTYMYLSVHLPSSVRLVAASMGISRPFIVELWSLLNDDLNPNLMQYVRWCDDNAAMKGLNNVEFLDRKAHFEYGG